MIWRFDCPAVFTPAPRLESVTMSPVNDVVALTVKVLTGVVVPIPTLPLEAMLNHCIPDEDATVKRLSVEEVAPVIENLDEGEDEPTPMFPLASIVNTPTPDEDATWNGLTF